MIKLFDLCQLLIAIAIVGCSKESPQPIPQPDQVIQTPRIRMMPEIVPGPRPALIRDAKFFGVNDFVAARENGELKQGDLVCVEGHVDLGGEDMRGRYSNLSETTGPPYVGVEGDNLATYQILHGRRIVVHGRIGEEFHALGGSPVTQQLVDASLVTQKQIDEALSAEHE